MYRTSVYRRIARATAIKRKKSKAAINGWVYRHEGELSKGKIHCSCPICACKSSRFAGKSSNTHVLLDKQAKINLIRYAEQIAEYSDCA